MSVQEAPIVTLVENNDLLLRQLAEFVLTDGKLIYTTANEQLKSGCIGAHVRHIIDHYLSMLNATAEIDYDKRARSTAIESKPQIAYDTLLTLCEALSQIRSDSTTTVKVCTDKNQVPAAVNSSIARELCFLHSHTTHHMAIIRLLAIHNDVVLPDSFGKAASTQKFEKNV